MTIRNQISGQFSIIVASILTVFSLVIYGLSANYRQEEFYERLKKQARTTVRLLIDVQEVDSTLLKIIDRNSESALIDEQVMVFDKNNQLIYSNIDDKALAYQREWLDQVRTEKDLETHDGDNELIGLLFESTNGQVVALASAYDQFGRSKLRNLALTLGWGWLAGIGLTVVLGFFFAGRSLQPIASINQQIQRITANDLRQRLDEGNRQDEIDQLAINFNQVLSRLALAFEQQRSFVAHASHELRTPLATMKSDVQLALRRPLSEDQLRAVLQTMLPDIDRLSGLTNSLLLMARTLDNIDQMAFGPLRLDEIVFAAQEELQMAKPAYRVDIRYDQFPDSEADTQLHGNENLLQQVVFNLLDNACKYSANHWAEVLLSYDSTGCQLAVRDVGVGISAEDQAHIFEPFYRAQRTLGYEGFGIGLSICHRIITLHQGQLTLKSQLGEGSTFTVWLPRRP